jgi:hypothetical protein
MWSQTGHSNVRLSKPEKPCSTLANIVVVAHVGQDGCEIWNMVLRLGIGGSVTELSATGGAVVGR